MADKKSLTEKEIMKKIGDLKIELLRTPTKRAKIKRELARLLTMKNRPKDNLNETNKTLIKMEDSKK